MSKLRGLVNAYTWRHRVRLTRRSTMSRGKCEFLKDLKCCFCFLFEKMRKLRAVENAQTWRHMVRLTQRSTSYRSRFRAMTPREIAICSTRSRSLQIVTSSAKVLRRNKRPSLGGFKNLWARVKFFGARLKFLESALKV